MVRVIGIFIVQGMLREDYDKLIADKIDKMFKHTWICKECGTENHKEVRKCPCNKRISRR